jgi:uncharacterized protein (TIGR02466 family)
LDVISLFTTDIFKKKCDLDLESILQQCYAHCKKVESSTFSNKGGHQSHNFNSQELIDEIASSLPRSQFQKLDNIGVYQWVNINKKDHYNTSHNHDPFNGIALIGVFYVSVPKNSGNIVFYDPRSIITKALDQQYYNNGNDSFFIEPEENLLLIFPSWLMHSVDPNQCNKDRISISFNIYLNYENI